MNKIPVYKLSDLTVQVVEELIEKGEVFDVESSILSESGSNLLRDAFWSAGDQPARPLRDTNKGSPDSAI